MTNGLAAKREVLFDLWSRRISERERRLRKQLRLLRLLQRQDDEPAPGRNHGQET